MTAFALYRQPTLLNYVTHRHLKLARLADASMADGMHACFLAATEFAMAAREYVIVFAGAEADGISRVQPMVLLGVAEGENLFVEGTQWSGRYVPAFIRRYPFWTVKLEGASGPAVMYDAWWRGFSETEGDPLYEAENRPAPRLLEALQFIESFEVEALRTQAFCARLGELGLLREMTASVTLGDGKQLALNGFFTVDEDKVRALPDAVVVELHRNGMLAAIHFHLMSLGNLQALADRKASRMPAPAAAT